ncbi:hypothetical protein ACFTAO_05450 [Paenibacillus rhizoplanae]
MSDPQTASPLRTDQDEQAVPVRKLLELPLAYIRFLAGMFISRLGGGFFVHLCDSMDLLRINEIEYCNGLYVCGKCLAHRSVWSGCRESG